MESIESDRGRGIGEEQEGLSELAMSSKIIVGG